MNASPATVALVLNAKAAAPRVAWTTSTGDLPLGPARPAAPVYFDEDPYCFVCGRCTDHFAEHDDLVAVGMAEYDTRSGSVYRTERYNAAAARMITEATYQFLYGHLTSTNA